MRVETLERSLLLPRPREEVFAFFAQPRNLERITPPWLAFRILEGGPKEMAAAAKIRYRLRLRGIPLRWTSLIEAWEPPRRFVDRQLRGPYRLWVHEHLFEEAAGGTRVIDRIRFAVPGGALLSRWLVRPDLERIFDYRHETIAAIMGGEGVS